GLSGEASVPVGVVAVDAPLGDVAVQVVQAPRIRLLLSSLVVARLAVRVAGVIIRPRGVPEKPTALAQPLRVIAKEVRGGRASAAGVFPLGLARQAVEAAGLLTQPLCVLPG